MQYRQPENTISVNDAILIARVTERTVRSWISQGEIKHVKIRHRIWILKDSFEAYLNDRGINANSY